MPVGGHAHLRLRLFWYKGETSLLDKHRTLFTIIFIKSCWWWCTLLVHTGPHEVRQLLMTRMLQRLQTAHGGVTTSARWLQWVCLCDDSTETACGNAVVYDSLTVNKRTDNVRRLFSHSFDQSVRLRRLLVEAQIKFSPVTVGRWPHTDHFHTHVLRCCWHSSLVFCDRPSAVWLRHSL